MSLEGAFHYAPFVEIDLSDYGVDKALPSMQVVFGSIVRRYVPRKEFGIITKEHWGTLNEIVVRSPYLGNKVQSDFSVGKGQCFAFKVHTKPLLASLLIKRAWQNYVFFHTNNPISASWFDINVQDEVFAVVGASADSNAETATQDRRASSEFWATTQSTTIKPVKGAAIEETLITKAPSLATARPQASIVGPIVEQKDSPGLPPKMAPRGIKSEDIAGSIVTTTPMSNTAGEPTPVSSPLQSPRDNCKSNKNQTPPCSSPKPVVPPWAMDVGAWDTRTRVRGREAPSHSWSNVPPRAGYRDPHTGDVLTGDIRGRAQERQSRRETDTYHPPASTRYEGDGRPRPRSMGRSSLYARGAGAESTTGVSRRNEEYSRIINHRQCDQALLNLCIRAIQLKQQRTGQVENQPEEFLWRCLAQPEEVRSQLKQEDFYNLPYRTDDPVKYLIRRVGEIKEQWMPEVHSNQRWRFPCAFCGQRPYVSWDACFRCGSLRGT